MPRYRLKASVGWVANSETTFYEDDFDTEEEARQAAFEAACEALDAYAEPVAKPVSIRD